MIAIIEIREIDPFLGVNLSRTHSGPHRPRQFLSGIPSSETTTVKLPMTSAISAHFSSFIYSPGPYSPCPLSATFRSSLLAENISPERPLLARFLP